MDADRLRVGVIAAPHGLKGEAKVFPTTDDAGRFKALKQVYLETKDAMVPLAITAVRFSGKYVIVAFEGMGRIEDIERHRGGYLWIDRRDAVELAEDEYFVADLVGLTVVTGDGGELGILSDVIRTGANDVYAVRTGAGREILLPAIRDCILGIDMERRLMRVFLMEGLVDG